MVLDMVRKAVILVGGPSKGTRFQPLSWRIPKPLFPIGGVEMIWHPIAACAKVPEMKEILLIGFYESSCFTTFIERTQRELGISIQYLREYQPLGTGGGIYHFREQILRGKPVEFFVLHYDICCAFPLTTLLECHQTHAQSLCTVLGKHISESPSNYGCIVSDPSGEVTHYAEKPETFVSDLINCGVYVFSPQIFDNIGAMISTRSEE
jgi:mannose-1-phosphate guanylyltransferase